MSDKLHTILETTVDMHHSRSDTNRQKKRSRLGNSGVTFMDGAPGAGKTFHTIRYVSGKKVVFLVTRTAPSVKGSTLYKEYAQILGDYERWTLNQSEPPQILMEKLCEKGKVSDDENMKLSIGSLLYRLEERVKKIEDVSRVKMLIGISQAGFETHFDRIADIVELLVIEKGIPSEDIVFVFDDVVPDAKFGVSRNGDRDPFNLQDYVETQTRAARLDLSRGYVSQQALNNIRYRSACGDPDLEKRIVYKEEGKYNTLHTSITAHAILLWQKYNVRSCIIRANYLHEQGYTLDILHSDHETPVNFRYVRANRNGKRVINIIRVGKFPSGKIAGKKILGSYLDTMDRIFKEELKIEPDDDSILYIVNKNMLDSAIDKRMDPEKRRIIVYGTDGINSHANCTNLVMLGGVYSSPRDESIRTKVNGFDATPLLNIMQTIFRSSLRVDHASEPVNIFVPGKGSLASAVYESLILGGYSRDQIHVYLYGAKPEDIGKINEFETNITNFHYTPMDSTPEIHVTAKVKNWPDKSLHEHPFSEPQHAVLATVYKSPDIEKKDLVCMKINNHGHTHCIVLDVDSSSLSPFDMEMILNSLPFKASVHNSPSHKRYQKEKERKYHIMIPIPHRIETRDTKRVIYGVIVEILLKNPELDIYVKDGKEIVHMSPDNKDRNRNYMGKVIKADSWPMAKKRLLRRKKRYMFIDLSGMDATNKLLHIPSDIWFMHLNWKDEVSNSLLETRKRYETERKKLEKEITRVENWLERLEKEYEATRTLNSPTLGTAKEYTRHFLEFPQVYDCSLAPSDLVELVDNGEFEELLEIVPFEDEDYRYLPRIDRDFIQDMFTKDFPVRHSLSYLLEIPTVASRLYAVYDWEKEYPEIEEEATGYAKELFDSIEDEELRKAAHASPILRHICHCRDCKEEHEYQLQEIISSCRAYLKELEKKLASLEPTPVPWVSMENDRKPYASVSLLLAKSIIATTYIVKFPKNIVAISGLPTTNPPPKGKNSAKPSRKVDWEILRRALSKDGVFTDLIKSGILSRALAEDRNRTIRLVQDASPPPKTRDRLRRLKTLKTYK